MKSLIKVVATVVFMLAVSVFSLTVVADDAEPLAQPEDCINEEKIATLDEDTFEAKTSDGFEYSIENGEATITGYTGSAKNITIPSQVLTVKNNKFVIYPVTKIGEKAFRNNETIESVTIPDSVNSIGKYAFDECVSLEKINIPSGVTVIEDNTFYGCWSLSEIELPEGLTRIGEVAFYEAGFSKINIPGSVKRIECSAFDGCPLTEISIPAGVNYIGTRAFAYSNIKKVTVDKNNKVYHAAGNCLIETKTKTLIEGFNTSTIPDDGSVVIIGASAFNGCSKLTKIIIPSSVKKIEGFAFSSCNSLSSIVIPRGVEEIGNYAFYGADIKTVYFKGNPPTVGQTPFTDWKAKNIYYPKSNSLWTDSVKKSFGDNVTWVPYDGKDAEKINGKWYYTVNGKPDLKFTGFANSLTGGRWRIEKGLVNFNYSDVVKDENQWRYYSGGKFQTGTTSVVKRSNGSWWYVKNGVVQFNVTDVVKRVDNNTWWYVKGGQVQFKVTSVVKRVSDNTWWYVKNGQVQIGVTSVEKRADNNTWWYVKNGQVQFNVTNVVKRTEDNTWWYVKGGKVQTGVTSVVKRTDTNTWWYVKNGQVQFNVTSVVKRTEDNTWWYVKGGKVQTTATGIVKRVDNNTWWYVKGGKVQFGYNGIAKLLGRTSEWYVKGGKVQMSFTGYVNADGSIAKAYEYYISKGTVDTKHTGWYEVDGVRRFYYEGKFFSTDTELRVLTTDSKTKYVPMKAYTYHMRQEIKLIYKIEDYYFRLTEGADKYNSFTCKYSSSPDSGYKSMFYCTYDSNVYTDGKEFYYIHSNKTRGKELCKYDFSTNNSTLIRELNQSRSYEYELSYSYSNYIYITEGAPDELDDPTIITTFLYDTKSGSYKKVVEDRRFVLCNKEYVFASDWWIGGDVSPDTYYYYKIQSNGSLKYIRTLGRTDGLTVIEDKVFFLYIGNKNAFSMGKGDIYSFDYKKNDLKKAATIEINMYFSVVFINKNECYIRADDYYKEKWGGYIYNYKTKKYTKSSVKYDY